jgi:hypothetical protein
MIEHLSANDLLVIAGQGGGFEVNGAQFSALDLGIIASRLRPGATLKIFNSNSKLATELGSIAAQKPGQVIFA